MPVISQNIMQLNLPQATAWTQPRISEIPSPDLYEEPLLIKLA